MNAVPIPGRRRWVTRKVRGASVVIDGRTYRPVLNGVSYAGQLDGHRCMFRRDYRTDGSTASVVTLWGTWDPVDREYSDEFGPHCVGGRFPFAVWSTTEEDVR